MELGSATGEGKIWRKETASEYIYCCHCSIPVCLPLFSISHDTFCLSTLIVLHIKKTVFHLSYHLYHLGMQYRATTYILWWTYHILRTFLSMYYTTDYPDSIMLVTLKQTKVDETEHQWLSRSRETYSYSKGPDTTWMVIISPNICSSLRIQALTSVMINIMCPIIENLVTNSRTAHEEAANWRRQRKERTTRLQRSLQRSLQCTMTNLTEEPQNG